MTIYYSSFAQGFYDTSVMEYSSLPNDCVEITEEERTQFIHQMNHENKKLILDKGKLVLVDRPIIITWENIRDKRNGLLDASDYTQVPDFPGDRSAWAAYRQLLRDIPQTFTNPKDVVWPEKPNS